MVTSSYDEEKAALTTSLEYLTKHFHHDNKVLIETDSHSLCRAIENGLKDTADIVGTIAGHSRHLSAYASLMKTASTQIAHLDKRLTHSTYYEDGLQ